MNVENFLLYINEFKNIVLNTYFSHSNNIKLLILVISVFFGILFFYLFLSFIFSLFSSSKKKVKKSNKKIDYDNLEEESVSEVPISLMENAPPPQKNKDKTYKKKKIELTKISTFEEILKIEEEKKSKKTILIVDDSKVILKQSTKLLGEKYNILTAENGFEALKKLECEIPDVILSDIEMSPNQEGETCDGFELLHKVKQTEKFSAIPFILMTANLEMVADKGFDLGANGFLSKPLDKEIVLEQIEYCLNI